jgi:penicillin amidase
MGQTRTGVIVRAGAALLVLIGWVILLHGQWGSLPQMGPLFNPYTGFWQNAEFAEQGRGGEALQLSDLNESVQVSFDERGVPHIRAAHESDLYVVQGYITARDRLFQMELQIRAAGGRLSEWVGPAARPRDRYMRRIGMRYAAEQALDSLRNDPVLYERMQSYADGVNAWIRQLDERDYPLEYKLMGVEPEPWSVYKSMLLMKQLTYTLAGRHNDLRRTLTKTWMGEDFLDQFFDGPVAQADPVIPNQDIQIQNLNKPQIPNGDFELQFTQTTEAFQPHPNNGSNNWVVAGSKTQTGRPILANDPHLGLTLPSIWYEVQLTTPDYATYGVSFPGAPSVILGFNEHIAWGSTNVGADVMDFYQVQFKDSTKQSYRFDGAWEPVTTRMETLRVRGEQPEILEIPFTRHGPVVRVDSSTNIANEKVIPVGHALRWQAHDRSNILATFYKLNRARNYQDYTQALRYFNTPAQNLAYADKDGNIALWVTGKFPLKWEGQGRTIGDGSNPDYLWQDWIPFSQNPHSKNPRRGFVSSANQDPAGSRYPYYLDDRFGPYERGKRINERLEAMEEITPQQMQELQLDVHSLHAQSLLPLLLEKVRTDTLTDTQLQMLDSLAQWNYAKTPDSRSATLFDRWWEKLYYAIWRDEYDQAPGEVSWPDRDVVAEMLRTQPDATWIDDITTPHRETLADLVRQSFGEVSRGIDSWSDIPTWSEEKAFRIPHLANIPGLSSAQYAVGGDGETINAIRGSHGPSWRMVVSMEDTVRAWGVFPGGPSGNPGSPYYNLMVEDWVRGELHPLPFYRDVVEWNNRPPEDQWNFNPQNSGE